MAETVVGFRLAGKPGGAVAGSCAAAPFSIAGERFCEVLPQQIRPPRQLQRGGWVLVSCGVCLFQKTLDSLHRFSLDASQRLPVASLHGGARAYHQLIQFHTELVLGGSREYCG